MLRSLGCDINEMKLMIEDLTLESLDTISLGHLQLNQKAEKILRLTFEEANKLNRKNQSSFSQCVWTSDFMGFR